MLKIYIFGNEDLSYDNTAIVIAEKIHKDYPQLEFITIKPNEDLPFDGEEVVVLMDVVYGLKGAKTFDESQIDSLVLSPRGSAHDFDLNFQLKYLKKLGKINKLLIIGLPGEGEIDYSSIHSIFKKLVAQDIQGS